MRFVLVLGLSMLLASADAAPVHRGNPPVANSRARTHVIAHPRPGEAPPARFSVPGWSDEQTRQWFDSEGCG
jgi:hypothetical protein